MMASELVKGKAYDYVRKDGSRHTVTYMYASVNFSCLKCSMEMGCCRFHIVL